MHAHVHAEMGDLLLKTMGYAASAVISIHPIPRRAKVSLREEIPVGSVIPVSNKEFEVDDRWDDVALMRANNSPGFNC